MQAMQANSFALGSCALCQIPVTVHAGERQVLIENFAARCKIRRAWWRLSNPCWARNRLGTKCIPEALNLQSPLRTRQRSHAML